MVVSRRVGKRIPDVPSGYSHVIHTRTDLSVQTNDAPTTAMDPPSTGAPGPDGDLNHFRLELSRAMRAAAHLERDRVRARWATSVQAQLLRVRSRAAAEADELRHLADADIEVIQDDTKADAARIYEEADRRIDVRQRQLEQHVERHASITEREVGRIEADVEVYEPEIERFFAHLTDQQDPAELIRLADLFPQPPDLDEIGDAARAQLRQTLAPEIPFDLPQIPAEQRGDAAQYASVDSAPAAFAEARSPRVAPAFLAVFVVVAAALVLIQHVAPDLQAAVLGSSPQIGHAPDALRTFFVAFYIAYVVMAPGPVRERVRFGVGLVLGYLLFSLVVEALAIRLSALGQGELVLWVGYLLIGYAGIALLSIAILRSCRLPEVVAVPITVRRSPRFAAVLVIAVLTAAGLAALVAVTGKGLIEQARAVALLGGVLPGFFLFRTLLWGLLFGIATGELSRGPALVTRARSVAFLVPAFNEAEGIAACIQGLDRAAIGHPGWTRIYVVDNASTDRTVEVARTAILGCLAASGVVLLCPQPGKARALNLGLQHIKEEIVIRVDADTVIEPDVITRALPYFEDPGVGAVGGVMLPASHVSPFARFRTIEVLYQIAFIRVSQNAVDTAMVVPGFCAVYRRDLLQSLGGFVTGMNGEDMDITVRIGRTGHRVITDPRIRVRSEVPSTLRHLREQRLRWNRVNYHIIARNLSGIGIRLGPRGFWTMPWAVINLVRPPMFIPFLLFGVLLAAVEPSWMPTGVAPLLGAVVGLQLLATLLILVLNRRLDLVPHLPGYLAFRLLRSYFALESFLTLVVQARARRVGATWREGMWVA